MTLVKILSITVLEVSKSCTLKMNYLIPLCCSMFLSARMEANFTLQETLHFYILTSIYSVG